MTDRERLLAVLRGERYDRLPILHFGFLTRTIERWRDEGHLTRQEAWAAMGGDASAGETVLTRKLGFDANYHNVFAPNTRLSPWFESKVLEVQPDGRRRVLTGLGTVILDSDSNQSIPPVIDCLLKGRAEWESLYRPKLQFSTERVTNAVVHAGGRDLPFSKGGLKALQDPTRDWHCLLHCGTLYGGLRDLVGVEALAYLTVDDEDLLDEMIEVNAELSYRCTEAALATGAIFDLGHFWEDICFKNGPLVNPKLFADKVGPHYRRITDLLRRHGVELISLDCDGMIDHLLPVWLENGINVMFPIEVGTWGASLTPWRERYGPTVLGVGGVDKKVFARDYAAVDAELERLRPIIEQGGFIPCPDHRLPHDNKWENVQYYCERLHELCGA